MTTEYNIVGGIILIFRHILIQLSLTADLEMIPDNNRSDVPEGWEYHPNLIFKGGEGDDELKVTYQTKHINLEGGDGSDTFHITKSIYSIRRSGQITMCLIPPSSSPTSNWRRS